MAGTRSGTRDPAMNFSIQGLLKLLLDPRFITLIVVSLLGIGLIALVGNTLIPFVAAAVLTYFLDGGMKRMMRWNVPKRWAFLAIFAIFLVAYFATFLVPVRLAVQQGLAMMSNLPRIQGEMEKAVLQSPEPAITFLPPGQREEFLARMVPTITDWMAARFQLAMQGIPDVTEWVIYALLTPLLVFFFLKDKDPLLENFAHFLPKDRELIDRIFLDVEQKTARYVRGTVWRILIVGVVTWLTFLVLGFQYAAILGLLTGLSVLVPYIGSAVVAVPLLVLGFDQYGISWSLGALGIAYGVINILDGYVLGPVLFSIAVKLHPVTILVAVFAFGNLWGFWGLVFAIPLATLVKSFVITVIEHQDKLV
jgi:putative permease